MRRRGFTIVELAVAVVVFLVILAASTNFAGRTGAALATGTSVATLEARANRLLDRIAAEVRQAGAETIDPALAGGGASLAYRRCVDFDAGEVRWGPPQRIEVRPAEPADGIDNDSDGLVDELRIVWIRDPGEPEERVVEWASTVAAFREGELPNGLDDNGDGVVDERGLWFRLSGDTLTIGVTVQGRDAERRLVTRSATTAVRLRN